MSWKTVLGEVALEALKAWWNKRKQKKAQERQKIDESPQDVV